MTSRSEVFERFIEAFDIPEDHDGATVFVRRDEEDEWLPAFRGEPYEILPMMTVTSFLGQTLAVMTGRAVEALADDDDREPQEVRVVVMTLLEDGAWTVGAKTLVDDEIGFGDGWQVFDDSNTRSDGTNEEGERVGIGGMMTDALSTVVDAFLDFREFVEEKFAKKGKG